MLLCAGRRFKPGTLHIKSLIMIGKPSLSFRSSASAATFIISRIFILIVCEKSNAFIAISPTTQMNHLRIVQNQQVDSRLSLLSSISSSIKTSLKLHLMNSHPADDNIDTGEWTSLTNDDTIWHTPPPVRKRILVEGTGGIPSENEDSIIELQYTGTLLGERNLWSCNDVVQCWLGQLQGLEHLSPKFIEQDIDGNKLMDESYFTEQFCMETLGMESKVQAKKLVMAARRLTKQQVEYPSGTVFDSSGAREGTNYTFVLTKKNGGRSKVIPAIELAVRSMKVGERSRLICRSDYAYGSEGLRSSKGEVIVPPFAMLCFDLTLVNVS